MKILVNNKYLRSDYEVLQSIECGIALTGAEVKSVLLSHSQISNAKCIIRNGELLSLGITIKQYQANNKFAIIDETRTRKLLLRKSEIKKLYHNSEKHKAQILIENIHLEKNRIKCQIALCKKFRKHDKRESIKERDFLQKGDKSML